MYEKPFTGSHAHLFNVDFSALQGVARPLRPYTCICQAICTDNRTYCRFYQPINLYLQIL